MFDLISVLSKNKTNPDDDIQIIRTWTEYDSDRKKMKYLMYELEIDNAGVKMHLFKAIKMVRVIRLPKSAKQSEAFMSMHAQILKGVWERNINMVTIIANMLEPKPLGLLFCYGIQNVASTEEEAKRRADLDFATLAAALQGTYRVLSFTLLNYDELEWLREKMFSMKNMTVVRGIPRPKEGGVDAGNTGIGSKNINPDSQDTTEELIAGMSEHEYIIQIMSSPVKAEDLERWLQQTAQEMTRWNKQLQGSSTVNFSLSIPMMYMANLGASEGWSHSYTDASTVSTTQSESFSTSMSNSIGASMSQSVGETLGRSLGESYTESYGQNQGLNAGQNHGANVGSNLSDSWSNSVGQSVGQNIGASENASQGHSVNQSTSESLSHSTSNSTGHTTSHSDSATDTNTLTKGTSTTQSTSTGSSHTTGTSNTQSTSTGNSHSTGTNNSSTASHSSGDTYGTSSSQTYNDTDSSSHSEAIGRSESSSYNESTSNSDSSSFGSSVGRSFFGASGNVNAGTGSSHSETTGNGDSWGTSKTTTSTSGYSHSSGTSESKNSSFSVSDSTGSSRGTSETLGTSSSSSASKGTSESWGTSSSSSLSNGTSQSTSVGHSTGYSDGYSDSVSQSTSMGWTSGTSSGQGDSWSNGSGKSWGSSLSDTVNAGASNSAGTSKGESWGLSSGESEGLSQSQGYGKTQTDSYSKSMSQSTGKSWGQSQGVSQGESWGTSQGRSLGQALGTTGTITNGTSSTMGLGPSLGFAKSYQWLDQEVQNILTLLDFQNQRLMKSLRGTGAFYTDIYIATESEEALAAVSILSKTAWHDESAMICPLQVLDLSPEEQAHLLYHFAAFSPDNAKENLDGQMQSYRYSTIILSDELTAYTHLPRISEGGVYADVGDIPKFAVPSMMKGDIYLGKVLSAERWTMEHENETRFEYRLAEDSLMHGIFTGESRSGKTVAATRFISELTKVRRSKTGKRMRIVALDPKQDWRILAKFVEPERFHFYSLGNPDFLPINLNICKVPHNVNPQTWIDGIIEIYCRSYGLMERGKSILAETFYELYDEAGVFEDSPNWRDFVPERSAKVTFTKVYERMNRHKLDLDDPTRSGKGRAGNEARDAYTRVLDRMQVFGRKFSIETRLFGQESGIGIDELIGGDDVIVLESYGLESTFKNFVFGCITSGFFKYAQGHEGGFLADDQYETVLVIEEANEILTGNDTAGGKGGMPSFGGQSEFEKILDQAAGLGLFIFSITQKIADMPSSVIANSGLLFAGKISREEDTKVVIRKIGREERLDDRDILKWFPRSPIGWFVCRSSRNFNFLETEPVLVHIDPLNVSVPDNQTLEGILAKKRAIQLLKM